MLSRFLSLSLLLVIAACTDPETENSGRNTGSEAIPGHAKINAEELARHIATLSSDEFEGRSPSSPGETKTINYIEQAFQRVGLQPGNNGSYFQAASLVELTATSKTPTLIRGGDRELSLEYGTQAITWTTRVVESAAITDSELVFVGYGVVAPEYNWDDYRDLDVRGKTVVMFVNDPGFGTQNPDLFNGNTMTYYGRWTYKFEEAARQGAAGAFLIHETDAAGYGWQVVKGWERPQFDLIREDNNASRVAVEGWLSTEAARTLFKQAGMSFDEAKAAALQSGFNPRAMGGLTATAGVKNAIRESTSNNVIGFIPGSEHPEESIIFMGHWDHLGVNPALEGDQIHNGAVDNAVGVAALIEIASAMQPLKPARSMVFLAVAAEESGLLGSAYYTENPLFPLNKTVAVINMDAFLNVGRTRDVTVTGFGNSELELYLDRHAKKQGRHLSPEPTPEKGYFYRSDHFNFAKKGVPSLFTATGIDHVTRGKEYGQGVHDEYRKNRYHQPADEYDKGWDLSGIVEDIELFMAVGAELGQSRDFPNWYEGNEFRAIRDQSRQ